MVFASLTFLYVFFPLSLVLYFMLRSTNARNLLLTAFSLVFYAWGEPVWLSLLLFSSVFDWSVGLAIERLEGKRRLQRLALVLSLGTNLTLLGSFKYADLVTDTINALTGWSLASPGFSLPIGISFYTFQTMSYVIDVYRGEVPAQRSFGRFLLFVSLFHQLVAGPIVRYADVAHDIVHRVATRADFGHGATRFTVGLFKKVCIANVAGALVQKHLEGDLAALAVGEAWFGLLMYSLQIYFDFSGYSDMAIGMGLMVGFRYLENFNAPYIARSATDFWRRWHMSLGTFFRDYVYIPLGGKEHRPYRNLFIVWGLTGLWHGASWNFMLWGLYYGALIALERLFLRQLLERVPRPLQHAYLLLVVVMGWALFYFTDLARLGTFCGVAWGLHDNAPWSPALTTTLLTHASWLVLALLLCTPLPGQLLTSLRRRLDAVHPLAGAGAVAVFNVGLCVLATAMLVGKSYNPFLYFRF